MKGLPTGYNKDLQEDKEPLFDGEDTLAVSLDATRAVIAHLTLRPERTRRAASGLLLATDVADYLVVARHAVPPGARSGRRRWCAQLLAQQRDFEALSLDEWRAFSEHFGDDVRQHVTAAASVRARKTPQSTSPDAVRRRCQRRNAGFRGIRRRPRRHAVLRCDSVCLTPRLLLHCTDLSCASRSLSGCPFSRRLPARAPFVRSRVRRRGHDVSVRSRLTGSELSVFGGVHARPPVSARRRVGRLLSARAPHHRSRHRGDDRRSKSNRRVASSATRSTNTRRARCPPPRRKTPPPAFSPKCSTGCRGRSQRRASRITRTPTRSTRQTRLPTRRWRPSPRCRRPTTAIMLPLHVARFAPPAITDTPPPLAATLAAAPPAPPADGR